MDGTLARANLLSVVTLWNAFKFVMLPLGARLAPLFPHRHYAALFGFIWISYQVADTMAEVVGCTLGRQTLRVWGIGQVNRKSVAGTWACFLGSMGACLLIIWASDLPLPWLGLAAGGVHLQHCLRALVAPRDRRLHHGHRQRTAVLGLRPSRGVRCASGLPCDPRWRLPSATPTSAPTQLWSDA